MLPSSAIERLSQFFAEPGVSHSSDKKIRHRLSGLIQGAKAWFIARLAAKTKRPIVFLTATDEQAEALAGDIGFFTNQDVFCYPCHENLPFAHVFPSQDTNSKRIACLNQMAVAQNWIAVAGIQSTLECTIPKAQLSKFSQLLQKDEETNPEELINWLIVAGYERVSMVQNPGEFSVRGGIIDIFTPSSELPAHLDFFDVFIEEISLFDPSTQRSIQKSDELILLPAMELCYDDEQKQKVIINIPAIAETYGVTARDAQHLMKAIDERLPLEALNSLFPLFYGQKTTFLSYVPDNAIVLVENPEELEARAVDFLRRAELAYMVAADEKRLLADFSSLFWQADELGDWLSKSLDIAIQQTPFLALPHSNIPPDSFVTIDIETQPSKPPEMPTKEVQTISPNMTERFDASFALLNNWQQQGEHVALVAPGKRQAERLIRLIETYEKENPGLSSVPNISYKVLNAPFLDDSLEAERLHIICGELSAGFYLPCLNLRLVTEEALFGSIKKHKQPKKRRETASELAFSELVLNEPVVHRDFGIGMYRGLVKLEAGGVTGEYLHLEYRDNCKLYVPVDRLSLIQKYVGVEGKEPRIDKLGGTSWHLAKQKAKKAVLEIAHELVDLYARRRSMKGYSFSPFHKEFEEFEAAFPFEETADQAASIEEVISDMCKDTPMDRLLCGDVGFGKTEVVMRAAFKAVLDGKQVAVLVPTTLLAEQHERTFKKRLESQSVRIAAISRLKSKKEQQEILNALRQGSLDILIGTHRLLQSDIVFKDLGLLVIDEEHRFGVKHKEKLKALKQAVDCLTLTATPIPRTLQLSFLGLRDLSTIRTPPQNRLPVKTFIAELDDILIKDAIERELERGGQVFFVHNRVMGLARLAEHLQKLVPKAKIAIGHGQMTPEELEDVMVRFIRGEIDCLVCTTIIESGIDIPSANTMFINRADALGIADLYQLRGRVGRANEQAYAYFIVPKGMETNKDAIKRLKAVIEATKAGGGFDLAMMDLQMRGAGNILGIAQSGKIAEVGYEMFLELLEEAVHELKGAPPKQQIEPEVNLPMPSFIPDEYCPDVEERLRLYRRFAFMEEEAEQEVFLIELEDRFGEPPEAVLNLFKLMAIKAKLKKIGCQRLDCSLHQTNPAIVLGFGQEGPHNPEKLITLATKQKDWRFLKDGRLAVQVGSVSFSQIEQIINKIITAP